MSCWNELEGDSIIEGGFGSSSSIRTVRINRVYSDKIIIGARGWS
jgi:hypothetical protein